MMGGGSAHPATQETLDAGWHLLFQDGRAVYKHAVTDMLTSSLDIMERNNLTADDVDYLIPHQANLRIIEAVADRAKFLSVWTNTSTSSARATNSSLPLSAPVSHGALCIWSGISDSSASE